MTYILIFISLFLDGILSVIINQNSYFIPHILVTTLFLIYPKFNKKIKIYNLITIITGLLYDILYTNLLFFHAIIFFLLGIIIKYLYKNYNQQRRLINIMSLIIVLTTYIFLTASSLYLFKITNVKIVEIIEFISKSMTLNIIYLVLLKPIFREKSY